MLKIRSGAIEPPKQTMARFVSGLKNEIACIAELQRYDTLEDAMQLALKIERQRRSNPYKAANSRFGSSNKSYSSDIKVVKKSTVVTDVREDRNIADKGKGVFGGENKRETPGSSSGKTCQIKCFKCLGFGHIVAQCPNRRVMTAIEMESEGEEEGVAEPEDLSAVLDEYYGDVETEEHGDQGDD